MIPLHIPNICDSIIFMVKKFFGFSFFAPAMEAVTL